MGLSFLTGKQPKTIYALAQQLPDDQEYFQLLLNSISEPVIDNVNMPGFPDANVQTQFVGAAGEEALREGFRFYRVVREYAKQTGQPLGPNLRVLDFGCGWGRISRLFFQAIPHQNFFGVDVDPDIIAFCAKNLRHGNYSTVQALPPTRFAANTFDVIFAYSVFSHLAEPVALGWVKEFRRILRPGGILVATTQGRSFLDLCQSKQGQIHEKRWFNKLARSFLPIETSKSAYDLGNFLFEPTGEPDPASIRNNSYYGEALIPLAYIQKEYTPYLNLIDFVNEQTFLEEAQTKLPQALFLMQKPI